MGSHSDERRASAWLEMDSGIKTVSCQDFLLIGLIIIQGRKNAIVGIPTMAYHIQTEILSTIRKQTAIQGWRCSRRCRSFPADHHNRCMRQSWA